MEHVSNFRIKRNLSLSQIVGLYLKNGKKMVCTFQKTLLIRTIYHRTNGHQAGSLCYVFCFTVAHSSKY